MSERWHPSTCKECGKSPARPERISVTGLCHECGARREIENHRQLKAHDGPYFRHWRRRTLAAFGVVVDTDE